VKILEGSLAFDGPCDTPPPLKDKIHLTSLELLDQNAQFSGIFAPESVSKNVSKSMVKDSENVVKGSA